MMKRFITTTTLVAAGAIFSNAGVTYIDFSTVSSGTVASNVYTVSASSNAVSFSGSQSLVDESGNAVATLTGITMSNVGSVNSGKVLTSLPDFATSYFSSDDAYIWADGFSANNSGTAAPLTLTLTLSANTTYTIALLGGRNGAQSVYSKAFTSVSLATDSTTVSGTCYNSSSAGGASFTSYSGSTLESSSDLLVWTFTTGDTATTATLTATSGTYNAISISAVSAVPEPSACGLLAGLGALAFVAARRRRSVRSRG